jgi:putative tryptophan/tyrosine transport system substrate-binding protein
MARYIRRRTFLATLVGGAAATWPLAARAQQRAMPVVGFLRGGTPAGDANLLTAFRKGLSETGFVEGRNLAAIEFRWRLNSRERQAEAAADMVRRKVDVIVTPGFTVAALAAKALTATIPIVFTTSGDPVQLGLVASLNRPGGNVTGFTDMSSEIIPKQFGLMHELLPRVTRLGVLITRNYPYYDRMSTDARSAAAAFGGQGEIVLTGIDPDIDAAFAEIMQKGIGAFAVPDDALLFHKQSQILTLAARHAIPGIYFSRDWAVAGGLMSYGPPATDQGRQAGIYVGRILKGEKPADIPVARSTRLEFVINLATARAIGIEIPATLLSISDEVIE